MLMRCTITPISGVRCPAASVHRPPLATARRLQPAASGVRRLAASKGGDDGWLSWDDAPEMPRATNGAPAPANGDGAGETEWGDEVQSLADSLRSGQSFDSDTEGAGWDPYFGEEARERCFLVGVALKQQKNKHGYGVHESLEELGRLADTAGLEVVGQTYQMLDEVNPRTYIGSGKVREIMAAVENTGATTVIFDDELSPGQLRNLERALGEEVRLCDRTALILDIFSQRAATREGKLQVELAQSEYQLPRLTRMWSHLERQSGSGQVKGMGEKQIEVDRRLLKGRMARLRRDLDDVRTHRQTYRDRRAAAPIPVVALVGYTNAGKSTLLNSLTGAGVLAEDKLFATLDPTTRRVELPGGKGILFTDTVGFIQKLPTQLVAAFRATLEEIRDAALLLHVVDVSHPSAPAQIDAVNQVLEELGVGNLPTLHVWNKVDACADPDVVRAVAGRREATVCISGLTGEGLPDLLERISAKLADSMVGVHVLIPYAQGELVDEIHRTGVVSSAEFGAAGTEVRAHVPLALAQRLGPLRAATAGVVGVAAHVAAAEAAAAADASAADGSWGCDDEELERLLAAEEVPLS
ncbi:GTP-binding hflX [Micractinium conductrix]|uniref:GTP-binding hflX n=1 Tax=Micractinium conductrix TaxID=554055 RepID=A0A2P6V7H3_9CHLO|nr:GTP-binding hflX [Micractinium conductrix]|eukprot:PSC70039.1 GTP-binding hflX [Micractinium conductrix]